MPTKKRIPKGMTADAIANEAWRGKDVSRHFTNKFINHPGYAHIQRIQRVNVDFTGDMLAELDDATVKLNVSRQAVIKLLLRQALDQHYLAGRHRKIA